MGKDISRHTCLATHGSDSRHGRDSATGKKRSAGKDTGRRLNFRDLRASFAFSRGSVAISGDVGFDALWMSKAGWDLGFGKRRLPNILDAPHRHCRVSWPPRRLDNRASDGKDRQESGDSLPGDTRKDASLGSGVFPVRKGHTLAELEGHVAITACRLDIERGPAT
ncbi:hypothetical protein KM043_006522 [Ampulex compressa]|nr:hypothetical protein KM043_006522 [Ampulex compressa]